MFSRLQNLERLNCLVKITRKQFFVINIFQITDINEFIFQITDSKKSALAVLIGRDTRGYNNKK